MVSEAGATRVAVEGALDAAAVTAAGDGRIVGLASCGTAPTPAQLAAIAAARAGTLDGLVLGFDDDPAGRAAAVRSSDRAPHLARDTPHMHGQADAGPS